VKAIMQTRFGFESLFGEVWGAVLIKCKDRLSSPGAGRALTRPSQGRPNSWVGLCTRGGQTRPAFAVNCSLAIWEPMVGDAPVIIKPQSLWQIVPSGG
jgi:hypothetical protein